MYTPSWPNSHSFCRVSFQAAIHRDDEEGAVNMDRHRSPCRGLSCASCNIIPSGCDQGHGNRDD